MFELISVSLFIVCVHVSLCKGMQVQRQGFNWKGAGGRKSASVYPQMASRWWDGDSVLPPVLSPAGITHTGALLSQNITSSLLLLLTFFFNIIISLLIFTVIPSLILLLLFSYFYNIKCYSITGLSTEDPLFAMFNQISWCVIVL